MDSSNKVPIDSVNFIKKFISKEFSLWNMNYSERNSSLLQEKISSFTKEFYSFDATILISRPKHPTEAWFSEAEEYLGATIERPLFKIEHYAFNGEDFFAAYTGSNDLGSNSYYEILIYKKINSQYKITSIYHSDSDGGYSLHEGEKFSFSKARLVAISKHLAPENEIDLADYALNP